MRVIDRLILRLEVLLRPVAADLSVERALGEMLIAGEWERALQFLEHRDISLVKDWQRSRRLTYGAAVTKFNFRNGTRMCQAVNAALADVPAETRYRIAELLFAFGEEEAQKRARQNR